MAVIAEELGLLGVLLVVVLYLVIIIKAMSYVRFATDTFTKLSV